MVTTLQLALDWCCQYRRIFQLSDEANRNIGKTLGIFRCCTGSCQEVSNTVKHGGIKHNSNNVKCDNADRENSIKILS